MQAAERTGAPASARGRTLLTLTDGVLLVIIVAAAVALIPRYTLGLGASTALTDRLPWGIWIGFNVLSGVALAAGGFTMAGAIHLFNLKRYEPLLRLAILSAFVGYVMVGATFLVRLGRYDRFWYPFIWGQPHSVLWEVAWCLLLYTIVVALEFGPAVFERLRFEVGLRVLRAAMVPLVVIGVVLSTLHQSSLGGLFLIFPHKLHPLWYSSLLPLFFFMTAVAVGPAMVIFMCLLMARFWKKGIDVSLLAGLGKAIAVVLGSYFVIRIGDLALSGGLMALLQFGPEGLAFSVEMAVGAVLPVVLLTISRVRHSRRGLFASAVLVIAGTIVNRLNVATLAFWQVATATYFPTWIEIAASAGIAATAVLAFKLAMVYLPVSPEAATWNS